MIWGHQEYLRYAVKDLKAEIRYFSRRRDANILDF
jgi:hypothetical protein